VLQQNPPVLNWVCQLTQVVLHSGCKTVVEVVFPVISITDTRRLVVNGCVLDELAHLHIDHLAIFFLLFRALQA